MITIAFNCHNGNWKFLVTHFRLPQLTTNFFQSAQKKLGIARNVEKAMVDNHKIFINVYVGLFGNVNNSYVVKKS